MTNLDNVIKDIENKLRAAEQDADYYFKLLKDSDHSLYNIKLLEASCSISCYKYTLNLIKRELYND